MAVHLYLSLIPEALIASMLPPADFGTYLAVGTSKRTRGQAMFFSLGDLRKTPFELKDVERRCVPHVNGEPKHSVYAAIYRVLEQIPLDAIRSLYLVTPDGRVMEIEPSRDIPEYSQKYHLYQEICPVHPRIVSSLDPKKFTLHVTDPKSLISIPKICFVDLRLGDLAENPETGNIQDLPYHAVKHLRDCLIQLRDNPNKPTKIVDRIHPQAFSFRTVQTGIFVGSGQGLQFYPFPSEKQLQSEYYTWWRSASIMADTVGV